MRPVRPDFATPQQGALSWAILCPLDGWLVKLAVGWELPFVVEPAGGAHAPTAPCCCGPQRQMSCGNIRPLLGFAIAARIGRTGVRELMFEILKLAEAPISWRAIWEVLGQFAGCAETKLVNLHTKVGMLGASGNNDAYDHARPSS